MMWNSRGVLVLCVAMIVGSVWNEPLAFAQGQPLPALRDVNLQRDIAYADTDEPAQRLDMLLPKQATNDKPLPVVVFIHGGGWRKGDKRSGWNRLVPHVASGKFAGVSVGYRLTDKAQWPAQIYDCKAAIRWIRGNAKQHNLDPERIVVWGTSAGGHLVALLGTTGGVKELEGKLGKHGDQSSRVTGVINFFGPSDLLTMNEGGSIMNHYAPDSPESKLLGHPVKQVPQLANQASALSHVTKDDAPFLIMHGTKDPLVPLRQSRILHEALEKAGVRSTLVTIEAAGHGFRGAAVDARVKAFLQRHLLDEKTALKTETISLPKGR